jgi:preprotein translocase subunit SecY
VKLADTLRAAWNEPELRQRILFIFAIFGVYAIALHISIPIPGVKPEAITELLKTNQYLMLLSTFGGGALRRVSIISLGLNPYITASIILQLMTVAVPSMKKEEQEGGQYARMKRAQRTRLLTLVLCGFQAWGLIQIFKSAFPQLGVFDYVSIILIWTAGAMLVLWLGEQIQEKGIGQGVSLMIFAGIVVSFPMMVDSILVQIQAGIKQWWQLALLLLIFVGVTMLIVYFTQAQRRINIQHMRRTVGTKAVGGGSSYLPIPVNAAGVIPIIFAISLVYIPAQFANFAPPGSWWHDTLQAVATWFNPNPGTTIWYQWIVGSAVYAFMIFFFTYFWTAIQYNVEDIALRLKQSGAYIPGVRQGKQTEQYLDGVISRITVVGAVFLALVALIPYWVPQITGLNEFRIIGGTSLLIIVSVVLDLMRQIEANLIMRGYGK